VMMLVTRIMMELVILMLLVLHRMLLVVMILTVVSACSCRGSVATPHLLFLLILFIYSLTHFEI